MNLKDPHLNMVQGSPTGLVNYQQQSQISLNPSYIQNSGIQGDIKSSGDKMKTKKRLKFDQMLQNQNDKVFENIDQLQSDENDEVQLHASNLMKCILQFFKSDKYSYFYVFTLIIYLINSTLQALQINSQVNDITLKTDFALQIFFTFSILVKLIQYQNQNIFWLAVDISTNICGYLAFGLINAQTLRYVRAIKTLRILLIANQASYLKQPASKLIKSLSSVGKILFPAAMFIYLYAVIGLYSFRDYQYSKCRDPSNKVLTQNWTIYQEQIFLCGQKQCPIYQGVQLQCLNPIDFGVEPDYHQVDNIQQGYGLMKYNNIFYSLFSTFKQTFITGSSRLMLLGKQSVNYFYVMIYYLSFIYLLAYIYLNIFYGLLITNEQLNTDSQKRQSSFELRLQRASQKRSSALQNAKQEQKQSEKQKQQQKQNSKGSKYAKTQLNPSKKSVLGVKRSKSNVKGGLQNISQVVQDDEKLENIKQLADQQKSQFEQIINLNIQKEQKFFQQNNKKGKLKLQAKLSRFNTGNILDEGKENKSQSSNSNLSFSNIQKQDAFDEQKMLKYEQIMKKYFILNHIIVLLTSINILIDYEGIPTSLVFVSDCIDFAFYWIFLAQILFRFYIHQKYIPNQTYEKTFKVQIFVFVLCTIDVTYEAIIAQNLQHFIIASDQASNILRTFKYLRIFVLISSTPFFTDARVIFNSIIQAVYSIRFFSLLWLLVLLLFSIMGFHMFQGKVKVDHHQHLDLQNGHPHHIAFQGLIDSFIYTVFIFFNEEWDYFMFQQYVGHNVLIVIWQLIVLVVGLQILSKYFMTLLMKQLGDKLNEQDTIAEQNEIDILQDQQQLQKINYLCVNNLNKVKPVDNEQQKISFSLKIKSKQPSKKQQVKRSFIQKNKRISKRMSINAMNGLLQVRGTNEEYLKIIKERQARETMIRDLILGNQKSQGSQKSNKRIQRLQNILENKISSKSNNKICNTNNQNDSISIQAQSLWTTFKIKSTIILKSKFYFFFKILFILTSIACTLAMHPHQDPNSEKIQNFIKVWYVTVAFFALEIIFSIIAFGIIDYLKNLMNWIYLIVFAFQVLSLIPNFSENNHLQFLLSFRVLRIFVFIELKFRHDSDMRLTLVGFWKLLPKVINLLIITVTMYGFFAIILLKLHKDDFYYCDGYAQEATVLTKQDCMNWGGSWVQRRMNVSNIFSSLVYLFLLATTEGWSIQVMEAASLGGTGSQPEYGKSIWMQYFFSIFFFIGNMIMLNVFIGLSVYNFQKIKSQVTGLARLSKENKMWFSIKNTIYRLSPKMKDIPLDNIISNLTHTFKNSKSYKIMNAVLFVLFMINMSLYTTNMSYQKQQILQTILQVFIGFFMFQYVVSWIALGLRTVKQKKFIFETLAIIYFISLLVATNATHVQPKLDRILHAIAICFLAIRYFALLYEVQFIKKMINSLVSIFPQTANIWLLIFTVLFSYAVIGIYLFSYLKIGPQLNQFDQNYTTLPNAIFSLIKFSMLQGPILQIIDATSHIQPNSVCFQMYSYADFVEHGRMGCGHQTAGYIFFLSFHLIYSLILLSTLLAVIVDAYSQVRREQQSMVNKFQLQQVQKQWENYDPEATGYISYRDFWMFTAKLVKIYKVDKEGLLSHQTKQSFLKSLQIPIYEDQHGILSFQFHQVIEALTRIVVKQKVGNDWDSKDADKVFKNHHHNNSEFKMMRRSTYDSSHVLSLILIKSGLKVWKRKTCKDENTQQNLQNLFTFAKKEKEKAEINNEMINHGLLQTSGIKNQNEMQKHDNSKKDINFQVKKTKKDLEQKSKIEQITTINLNNPKKQNNKAIDPQQVSIQRVAPLANEGKSILKQESFKINKVNNLDRKVQSVKQNGSKIKSPRDINTNLYSDRTNMNKTKTALEMKQERIIQDIDDQIEIERFE